MAYRLRTALLALTVALLTASSFTLRFAWLAYPCALAALLLAAYTMLTLSSSPRPRQR